MKLPTSMLTRAAILSVFAVGGLVVSAFVTDNADYVKMVSSTFGLVGIVAAVLCGLAFSRYVAVQSSVKKSSGKGVVVGFGIIAALLFLPFVLFFGAKLESPAAFTIFIPGVLVAGLAFIASRYTRPNMVPPTGLKFLLIAGAFVGGVLPGLTLYFILSLILSERYCQLSSSKCM
jgi:hypothetical protein